MKCQCSKSHLSQSLVHYYCYRHSISTKLKTCFVLGFVNKKDNCVCDHSLKNQFCSLLVVIMITYHRTCFYNFVLISSSLLAPSCLFLYGVCHRSHHHDYYIPLVPLLPLYTIGTITTIIITGFYKDRYRCLAFQLPSLNQSVSGYQQKVLQVGYS